MENVSAGVKRAQKDDEYCKTLRDTLKTKDNYQEFFERNAVLFKRLNGYDVVVTPRDMEDSVIRDCHLRGYFSGKKLEELVQRDLFIPGLAEKSKVGMFCWAMVVTLIKTTYARHCETQSLNRRRFTKKACPG